MKISSDRSPLLDCIRMLAIMMVIVFHVATRYPGIELDAVATLLRRIGYYGVDMFFPLSGFLITRYLVSHSGPGSTGTFFLRRFFRIVPIYAVAILTFLLASKITGYDSDILDQISIPATFLTGWYIFAEGVPYVPYTITWSLSVEEFAYIVIGVAAWVSRRHLTAFLIAITIFAIGLRFVLASQGVGNLYYFPPTRLDSIALGGLLAVIMPRTRYATAWTIGLAVLTILLARHSPVLGTTFTFSAIALVTCVFISVFEGSMRSVRPRWLVLLSRIGFYSYFTYLFHFFFLEALLFGADILGFSVPFWGMVALTAATTHIAAVISFWVFEYPLMQFGRSLEKSKSVERVPN